MAYEQVQKPSSSKVPVQKKGSEFSLSASRVQAKDDTASEQEQMPKVSTPATDANWLMKHPLFKGNQFLQREVAPQSESLESEEETLQRQEAGKEAATPYSLPVQAKLTIGAPGDKYEQEADRVASQVVKQINSPEAASSSQGQSVQRQEEPVEELQRQPSISDLQRTPLPLEVQRVGMPEGEELQASSILQRREAIAGGEASTDLDTAINSARGGGQPLEAGLQRSMGQAMGADFSGVRVHTDAKSDQLNQSIQAKAFTTGQDVFFRQGAYAPGSRGGQELIAHELTHVVQQNGGTEKAIRRTEKGKREIQRQDDKETEKQENHNLQELVYDVGTDQENGVMWKTDRRGNFGYVCIDSRQWEKSRAKEVCPAGVSHSELWWHNRQIKLPDYNEIVEGEKEKSQTPYVYHITDEGRLSGIKEGFKPRFDVTGKKEAHEGGSTKADSSGDGGKEREWQRIVGMVVNILWESEVKITEKSVERMVKFISEHERVDVQLKRVEKEGEDEDLERITAEEERVSKEYITAVTVMVKDRFGENGRRSKKALARGNNQENEREIVKITELRDLVKKQIIKEEVTGQVGYRKITKKSLAEDYKSHQALEIAVHASKEKAVKEGMVASQHVYVFTEKDWEAALKYADGKESPVILRMRSGNFTFLAQDSQAGEGYRSRNAVNAEEVEYYKPATKNGLKNEWVGLKGNESIEWKKLSSYKESPI